MYGRVLGCRTQGERVRGHSRAMRDAPALSAIVVNYNTAPLTQRCVASLRDQEVHGPQGTEGVEILVVDNASRPQDRQALAGLDAIILYNEENRGYGAALNQACARASAEYILFSNSDTWYCSGSLQALLDGLLHSPKCGAVGPRFWWDMNREFLLPPADPVTLVDYLLNAAAQRWPRGRRRRERRWRQRALRHWQARKPLSQVMLSGACILTRREVLAACGGFDERFHLYYEDTDWCRRVRHDGYRLYYVPDAEVVHMYNQSARQQAAAAQQTFADSATRYFRKHYGNWLWGLASRITSHLPAPSSDEVDDCTDLGTLAEPPRCFLAGTTQQSRYLLLLSPLPSCIPAIARFLAVPQIALPLEVWKQMAEGDFYMQLLSLPDLRPLGKWCWRKG